jgi:DNA helicase-2/ATP-dependent DNA helicase PcrA
MRVKLNYYIHLHIVSNLFLTSIYGWKFSPIIKDTGGGFFRKKEILDCYYMIQAILKYRDDVSLDLALGTPFLPFRPPVHIYRQNGTVNPLCDWFESEAACRDWYNGIMTIRKRMKIDLVPQLLTSIYEFTRVREFFKQQGNA